MIKINRSFPAPLSLEKEAKKKNGSYVRPDVVEQLRCDFHNKCYICELKNLQDPQVEHLLPHKNGKYPDRKFDWNNLFWVCGHCNGVKNQQKYEEGILDCCKENPEELIGFKFKNNQIEISRKTNCEDAKIDRTILLIQEVFDLKNTGMRIIKSDVRFKGLQKEMNLLYDTLEEHGQNPESKAVLRKLKALLRKESAFAAFKRCYIRECLSIYPELEVMLQDNSFSRSEMK